MKVVLIKMGGWRESEYVGYGVLSILIVIVWFGILLWFYFVVYLLSWYLSWWRFLWGIVIGWWVLSMMDGL